jgi:phospholipase C
VLIAAVAATTATTKASASAVASEGGGGAKTPIQHVVVIFQENVSFDHYFGTYPNATGADGNVFTPKPGTPAVNGLTPSLLSANPNSANPTRLDSSPTGLPGDAGGQLTCDMDHNYSDEQQAFDGGKMDQFVQSLGGTFGNSPGTAKPCSSLTNVVMDYYDGNTVTGLWNYAQNYAMSDNSYETTFGPSSPGAINLISGDTGGVDTSHAVNNPSIATSAAPNADLTADGKGGYSLTSDAQPYWDDCSTRDAVAMKGKNIGDLLNQAGLSWGWFQGGFAPTVSYQAALSDVGASGQATSTFIPDQFRSYFGIAANRPAHSSNQGNCDNVTPVGVALGGSGQYGYKDDYIPHHEPFQYYASTANPHHLPPASLSAIGTDTQSYVNGQPQFDTANHQYDTTNFDQLVAAITANQLPASALPNVSFIKAPGYQDGHAAYSDPADEQAFVVHIINELEQSPDWSSTAVIINYDDSDGWYDHVYSGVTNPSASVADNLTNSVLKPSIGTSGVCGSQDGGSEPLGGEQGRCGFANRLPMLVISPYAKQNYVDHNVSDQSSIINFVEYNWGLDGIKQSFDAALARTDSKEHVKFDLGGMFDFAASPHLTPVLLDPNTGEVQP